MFPKISRHFKNMSIYRDVGIADDTPAMHGDWCPAGIFSSRSHFMALSFHVNLWCAGC